ncbi:MAG: tyrosine--tRNA ligase, partial [Clostridia bacterium]|nr:tyrosine--tRNA ligase [Clostridia bacterium]
MKRLQMAGNRPIALIGGGTTMIGDPSGRTDMRKMLTREDIDHNAECYKQRMEKGLSFLEFNYMIMQSYDFYYLYQNHGCNMQFGGDDQWSNMLGGTELIRRKLGKDAYAMTITLLTDSQGKKMGKTAGNAVWLDPNKTSPFDFYQYWRNVDDADVMKCLKMLTFIPIEQLEEIEHWDPSRINEKKELLAFELTKLVHGEEEAAKAQAAARALFAGGGDDSSMPTTELEAVPAEGLAAVDLLVACKLCQSKGEARRLIQQGGVTIDGEKVADPFQAVSLASLQTGVKIKKGKKVYHRAILKA